MKLHISQKVFVFALVTTLLAPSSVFAAYTMHGHTFATAEDMAVYMQEYLRVYNDLYGTQTETSGVQKTSSVYTASRITSSSQVRVTTLSPEDVDMYFMQLSGRVYFEKAKLVEVWFEYGPHPDALVYRSNTEYLEREGTSRVFDIRVTELKHNTTYYYRAMARTMDGSITRGSIARATTNPDYRVNDALVKANTKSASSIDSDRAYLNGSVSLKKAPYAWVWFEYGTNEDRLDKNTGAEYVNSTNASAYTKLITKLDPYETYYFRTVAQDQYGSRSYGKLNKLTTKRQVDDQKPTVETYRPGDITGYAATITALFDMNDYRNGKAFMVYGEDKDKISNLAKQYETYKQIREYGDKLQKVLINGDLDRIQQTKQTLLYLDPKTTYYVVFGIEYENDEDGDVLLLGRVQRFTTKDALSR